MTRVRLVLLVQLLVTLVILVAFPATLLQTFLLLGWWYVTFGPLRLVEVLFFVLVCALFTVMNAMALRHGVFAFAQRDVLGMPYFELFMWGFYGLHMWRSLGGPPPAGNPWLARGLVVPFALSFALVSDAQLLLASAGFALVLALFFCHEPWDLAYVAYAVGLGTVIEYSGIASGLWHYPEGGVPLWYVALWGGVGLFLRRLFVPVLKDGYVAKQPAQQGLPSPCTRGEGLGVRGKAMTPVAGSPLTSGPSPRSTGERGDDCSLQGVCS